MNKDSKKKSDKSLSEILRKMTSLGLGAAFMTEEAIKNIIQELPLPKDIGRGLLDALNEQKNELVKSAKGEVKSYLSNINPSKEIDKILTNYEVKVDAKLSFRRKKQMGRPPNKK